LFHPKEGEPIAASCSEHEPAKATPKAMLLPSGRTKTNHFFLSQSYPYLILINMMRFAHLPFVIASQSLAPYLLLDIKGSFMMLWSEERKYKPV